MLSSHCMNTTNLFNLTDKVIVITGATGALAGATARYLLAQGAHVVYLSRNPKKIEAAVQAAKTISEQVYGYACDVTDEDSLKLTAQKINDSLGRIDALINGAGGNMPGATITPEQSIFDLDLTDYDQVLDLNLKGTLLPSLIFGKIMAEQNSGNIINFSSMASEQAITRVVGYSNAKSAVDNLTRWMAVDFAKKWGDALRVNAIAPGFFVGDQNRALLLQEDGSLTARGEQIIANTPMDRFGDADEICGAIHYLLSDASRFVTGQVLAIDGGFSIYSGV